MVKVAVAGGTGNVATELLRAPIASGKHSITILTRNDPSRLNSENPHPGVVDYRKVNYTSLEDLTDALRGYDVCLSFLIPNDTGYENQKCLIDACVAAGVKRFAPSEWGIKSFSGIPSYKNKDRTIRYLEDLNQNEIKLEYCAFQPSIWMDYFAHPYPLSPHLITWPFFIDFNTRHAILPSETSPLWDKPIVITAIADVSQVLARALDDPTPWPTVGGMQGSRTSIRELFKLAEKIRGPASEWHIETIDDGDLDRGELKTKWLPLFLHPVVPEERREQFSVQFTIQFLKAVKSGAWDVSNEFGERYKDVKFVTAEEYLEEAWKGKPQ